ncbi:MAG: MotA/TolQ/ExbB proton channel family protein [Candidatus Omnitrophica bacterium]|nr:MotA/TolQ/ExbB proton channel family protein [Candidatus Omnitrophota bacterium]
MTISFINAWGILLKGGPMMWPILLLSVATIAVGIEKLMLFSAVEQNMKKLKPVFFKAIQENRMKDALIACEENSDALGRICKAGLMKYGATADLIKVSMEQAAGFEIHALKRRLNLLAFIPNAAVLLGLLGTSNALCVVFHAVLMRSNALNPLSLGDMSSGIWQALLTTSAGLSVGIIGYAIYSFTASRINDIVSAFEQTIGESAELLQGRGSS